MKRFITTIAAGVLIASTPHVSAADGVDRTSIFDDGAVGQATEYLPDEAAYITTVQSLTNPVSPDNMSKARGARVGNVYVIEDNGAGIVIPEAAANYDVPNDNPSVTVIHFKPTGGGAGKEYTVSKTTINGIIPPIPGDEIPVSVDNAFGIPLGQLSVGVDINGFEFPFMGKTYDSFFVNWDTSITFNVGREVPQFMEVGAFLFEAPSINALRYVAYILQAEGVGAVYASQLDSPNRMVITVEGAQTFLPNDPIDVFAPISHQVVLHESGDIELKLVNARLDPVMPDDEFNNGIIGISSGEGTVAQEIDFSNLTSQTITADAIYEEYHLERTYPDLDLARMSNFFYQNMKDDFDILLTYTDFATSGGNNAFFRAIRNDVTGSGLDVFNGTDFAGSDGELEGYVFMFTIDQFANNKKKFAAPKPKRYIFGRDNMLDGGNLVIASDPRYSYNIEETNGDDGRTLYNELYVTDVGIANSKRFHHRYKPGLIRSIGPTADALGEGRNKLRLDASGVGVIAHEVLHRWVSIRDTSNEVASTVLADLVGRGGAHWIPFLDNRIPEGNFKTKDPVYSVQQGGVIIELGINHKGKLVEVKRDGDGNIKDMSRKIKDPVGVFKDMVELCETTLGKTAFMTERNQVADGSSALEQYLMGVRKAEDVPDFFYIDNVVSGNLLTLGLELDSREGSDDLAVLRERRSLDDIGYCGDRVSVNVMDDIVSIIGERNPEVGDEVDAMVNGYPIDVKTIATILVVRGDESNAKGNKKVSDYKLRKQFKKRYKKQVKKVDMMRHEADRYMNGPMIGNRNAAGQAPEDADFDKHIPKKFDLTLDPQYH